MEKLKKFINKIKFPFLAFSIPVIVMIVLFVVTGGIDAEQLSIGDMQAQHVDLILYFKRILLGEESIFYSITKGLGGDMYSTMAYYMLSPINLLVLLFEDAKIMLAIRLIILVKVGLCGLTMYFLLNSKNKDKKVYSLMLALCYALMAFVINNYFCTLWLDGVFLAPLVIMGLDKLINEKKVMFYMITLFLSIFTNFYFGYMICLFSVVYLIYSLILKYKKEDKKEIINTVVRFIVASLLSGLAVAVIYIPSIISILNSDRTTIEANETMFTGFIYRMFIGSYSMEDFLSYFHPSLYCGLIVLILLVIFLFNKKIKEKEKVVTFSVILLFIFSILFHQLSYIWHGFSYPIGYNFRFSFLFCLFVLLIAHKQLCAMAKPTKVMKYALAVFILAALAFMFKKYSNLSGYISIALIFIYSLLIFSKKKNMQYILLLLIIGELGFNAYKTFYVNNDHFTTRESLETDICQNLPDSNGYRVAGYEYYGSNENIACRVSGTRLFSTTINSRITNFYTSAGLNGGINMYNDNLKNTPIIPSLLSVKYFYSDEILENYKLIKEFNVKKENKYHNEYRTEKNYIYENEYALSLGYMIKLFEPQTLDLNFFEFQNQIIKDFSGIEKDVLVRVEEQNSDAILDSKYLYFFFYTDVERVLIDDTEYFGVPASQIVTFENKSNKKEFTIEAYNYDGSPAYYDAYYLDLTQFLNAINVLQNNQLENIKIDKNVITGNINVKEDGLLALSIPYEDGLRLYVDGKEVYPSIIYNFFTGVELPAGEHEIKVTYVPKTFNASLLISIGALVLSTMFIVTNDFCKPEKKKIKKNTKKIPEEEKNDVNE